MFYQTLLQIISNIFYLALHVTNSGSFPAPLSAKQETALLIKKENGDENAKNKLIEHNLRLVAHVVKKYNERPCVEEIKSDMRELIGYLQNAE